MDNLSNIYNAHENLKSLVSNGPENFQWIHPKTGYGLKGDAASVAIAQTSDEAFVKLLFENKSKDEDKDALFLQSLDIAVGDKKAMSFLKKEFFKSGLANGDFVQLLLRAARNASLQNKFGKITSYKNEIKKLDKNANNIINSVILKIGDQLEKKYITRQDILSQSILPFSFQLISATRFASKGSLDRALLQLKDAIVINPVLFYHLKTQVRKMIREVAPPAQRKEFARHMKGLFILSDEAIIRYREAMECPPQILQKDCP